MSVCFHHREDTILRFDVNTVYLALRIITKPPRIKGTNRNDNTTLFTETIISVLRLRYST